MGKKVVSKGSSPSSRICKNNEKQQQQQQFRSVIKVLRPKVYITDTSNFKKLVQELTGNNARTGTAPSLHCDTPRTDQVNKQEDFQIQGDKECCMDMEVASIDSLASWNQLVINDEMNQSWNQIYEEANAADTTHAAFDASDNKHVDLSAARELESWLLDMEPCSFDKNGNLHPVEQDISAFDYYQLCELI